MSRLHSSCGSTARRKAIYTSLHTDVVLFFFSFFSKTSASSGERAPLHWRAINPLRLIFYHPLDKPVHRHCFIFLFVLFKNIGELASELSAQERTRSARKKMSIFFFPHHYPLALAVINPLRFTFYHPFSTDFEEKIEGLSTG